MNLDSIQALLEALKRSENKSGLPGDDDGEPIAAKVSVLKAKPIGADPDADADNDTSMMGDKDMDMMDMDMDQDTDQGDDKEAAHNAQVVDVLQSDYPQIYAKIEKQLGSKSGDLSDTTDDVQSMMG
jgi:hypothetical protein